MSIYADIHPLDKVRFLIPSDLNETFAYRKWENKQDMYDLFPPANSGTTMRFRRDGQLSMPHDFIGSPPIGHVPDLRILNSEWIVNLKTILSQNFFQKILTKVKNMFFKKRKEMQNQIEELQSGVKYLSACIEKNDKKNHELEAILRTLKDYTIRTTDYILEVSPEAYRISGYEYLTNLGSNKEIWVRSKKPAKSSDKKKTKKKK